MINLAKKMTKNDVFTNPNIETPVGEQNSSFDNNISLHKLSNIYKLISKIYQIYEIWNK